MSTNEKKFTKLSKELLSVILLSIGISAFTFIFLRSIINGVLFIYCDKNNIILTEMQEINYLTWITALSFLAATIIFMILFLVLIGQKLSYIRDILSGIEALTTNRLNFEIPVQDNNELTQLALAINQMSKTELKLKEKEEKLIKERENFIRAMSHDIRTPLTAIIAHTDYLKSQDNISQEVLNEYLSMTGRKAVQIKELTDLLLDNNNTSTEYIPDGRFLFVQLADEWSYGLEDNFDCKIHIAEDLNFDGDFNIQEFQRIFDNLSSNIQKYADSSKPIYLDIIKSEDRLVIEQSNYKKKLSETVESYKIGLESIRRIAQHYGGGIKVDETEEIFKITILLFPI